MNNVAVHRNSSYRDQSPSKLPRFQPGMNGKEMTKQPSRLEMLQADFQEKLLKEKEEKMIRMYEGQQERALGRVNQRSNNNSPTKSVSVRDFFQQRRTLEQNGYESPPMEAHYRQLRRGYSSGGYSSASSHVSSISTGSRYSKHSAGKDRSNLLQPLEKTPPPLPTRAKMARQKQNNMVQARNNANRMQNGGQYDARQNNSRTSSNGSSPPPNLQTLRNFQRKRLGAQPVRDDNEDSQRLTDFQKWQMEQNKAREQRLEKSGQSVESRSPYWNSEGSQWEEEDSSDGDKENKDIQEALERKQRELEEEIQRQKDELDQMKVQKKKEEEDQAKRAELERKREADQERRRQQRAEAERRRQLEEEERERKAAGERERKVAEEERKRQAYEERKRQQRQQQQRRAPPPKQRTPSPADNDPYVVPDSNADFYAKAAAMDEQAQGANMSLTPCKVCGRKFMPDRLAKHQSACKTASKPRKVFDPAKMRTEGTDMAKYQGRAQAPKKQPRKKDWRSEHESFIETIRYAKTVSQMEASGVKPQNLPPPPKSNNPDYVKCPKCNRSFNPSTAEKHIPNCRAKPRK